MHTDSSGADMPEDIEAVLDRDRLESLVEDIGDRALVREAVLTYLNELPDRLSGIRVAVALGDRDGIRGSAHALGSPSAMLGAVSVSATARTLQDAVLTDIDADLGTLVGDIETACVATAHEMRDYLDSTGG